MAGRLEGRVALVTAPPPLALVGAVHRRLPRTVPGWSWLMCWTHPFRHAPVRRIVRHAKGLALAQKQAGWARLHTVYLTRSDEEAHALMLVVPE
jgi:hypothetical protein